MAKPKPEANLVYPKNTNELYYLRDFFCKKQNNITDDSLTKLNEFKCIDEPNNNDCKLVIDFIRENDYVFFYRCYKGVLRIRARGEYKPKNTSIKKVWHTFSLPEKEVDILSKLMPEKNLTEFLQESVKKQAAKLLKKSLNKTA